MSKEKRYNISLRYIRKYVPKEEKILDLGTPNELSALIAKNGYTIENTGGEDLDDDFSAVQTNKYNAVTAFEIFEHLLAPYNILKAIKAKKLVATVPLRLWFKSAFWNDDTEWDRHFHEFEVKQFLWLLKKTGWNVIESETWVSPTGQIGIRPLLRYFFPRYLIVYCERNGRT
ncbi:MAG: hypothetical protein JW894_13760 [Bacteroidales bacterium]|nr:hypothetical protein [Bacteroidales bacterium]